MSVRPSKPHDIDGLLEVENECFDETNPRLLIRICGFTDTLLVYDDGGVRGYVLAAPTSADRARIVSLGVMPAYRGRGIGRSLMREATERLRSRGVDWLELEVRVSNTPAKSLYDDLGFSTVGVKPGYYDDGEDAYLMEKSL